MNRTDLQRIAESRLREAKILLDAGEPAGSYYLAGYAIECALKACIAKRFKEHEFPDLAFVNKIYSHNLPELLKHAGLGDEPELTPSSKLWDHWQTVQNWRETKRYEEPTPQEAEALYLALADSKNGVFQWLKKLW